MSDRSRLVHQYSKTCQSPEINFCSPREFHEKVKNLPLPVETGEIPNDWCYMVGPCNARHMRMARQAQNNLPAAERFSVIAKEINPYFDYPASELRKAWNKLMELDGSQLVGYQRKADKYNFPRKYRRRRLYEPETAYKRCRRDCRIHQ